MLPILPERFTKLEREKMPKVKSDKPPSMPTTRLPDWVVEVRRSYTRLTCPRCSQHAYVRSVEWERNRRESYSAPCLFCFRAARIPPLEGD